MVLVRFELTLLALANYYGYGPFFVWRASLTLTRDAWADDGTKTEDDKSNAVKSNELDATVLGAAEALFEVITLADIAYLPLTRCRQLRTGLSPRASQRVVVCVCGPSPVCAWT